MLKTCYTGCERRLPLSSDLSIVCCSDLYVESVTCPICSLLANHTSCHIMSARVRFRRDPIQSVCRPLQLSELRLLHLLEDHMQDQPTCYWHLRDFRLARMCPDCRDLASYTILRFKALGGRYARRLECERITTFVEIPRSFGATRFILRSLTEGDGELLTSDERPILAGTHRATVLQAPAPSQTSKDRGIKTPFVTTYRRSAERHDSAWRVRKISQGREQDVEISFRRLVVSCMRDG